MLLKRNYLFIIINKTFTTLFFVYMIYQKPQILVIIRVRSPLPGASINYTDPVSQSFQYLSIFRNNSCRIFHTTSFQNPMIPFNKLRPFNVMKNAEIPFLPSILDFFFFKNKVFHGKPRALALITVLKLE